MMLDRFDTRNGTREESASPAARSQAGGSSAGTEKSRTSKDVVRTNWNQPLELEVRGRRYSLSSAEAKALAEVGRFRTLRRDDLAAHCFRKDTKHCKQVLDSLARQKLIWHRRIDLPQELDRVYLVSLSRAARELLNQKKNAGDEQRFYADFVKPREVRHDTAIYRMFQQERRHIESGGGSVRRVVLDHELKRNVFSALEKGKLATPDAKEELQKQTAERFELQVVDGRIPIPDLRIEYEDARGELGHVDLELATEHYKASQRSVKLRAGFTIYRLGGATTQGSGGGGTPYGEELLREVFSR